MASKKTLIHLISTNHWGGAQRYALDICRHFADEGWEVMAVTRDAKVVDSKFEKAGIPLMHAPLRGFFDPASAWMLAARLRQIPLEQGIVHVHRYRDAFTVLLAKRIAKRPDIRVVSTRHTVRPGRNSRLFRRIYDKIQAHIFVSMIAFERFRSTWPERLPMSPQRVHILHNSINVPMASPVPEPDKGPVFALYLGPIVKGKGIETIIDALPSLRGIKLRLRIAGQGNPDYLDTLRRRAMTRGVMEMIDWKIQEDVPDSIIAQSHFAVLPSTEREAFGISNVRVMAAGRPQICSPNGAQSEYLADGRSALFVTPADAGALAHAMRKLAENASLRAAIGREAFSQYSVRLAWHAFIRHLSIIYTSC